MCSYRSNFFLKGRYLHIVLSQKKIFFFLQNILIILFSKPTAAEKPPDSAEGSLFSFVFLRKHDGDDTVSKSDFVTCP